ncbi:MAG: hypothetical protein JWM11_3348 [Planctomycetaceae bacterium]|nr:hypothetical protein [Planctomycetaceae bacterium]
MTHANVPARTQTRQVKSTPNEALELASFDEIASEIPFYAVFRGDAVDLITSERNRAEAFVETFNRHRRESSPPAIMIEGYFSATKVHGQAVQS